MKTTLTALAVAFALTAGFGVANAMPYDTNQEDWKIEAFQPKD